MDPRSQLTARDRHPILMLLVPRAWPVWLALILAAPLGALLYIVLIGAPS